MNHDPEQSIDATESVFFRGDGLEDQNASPDFSSDMIGKKTVDSASTGSTSEPETRCDLHARSLEQAASENQVDSHERFGKYILLEQLGQGHSSSVHLCCTKSSAKRSP